MSLISTLVGCSSTQVSEYKNESPKLTLESYLNGPLEAFGMVTDRSGKVTRRFHCKIVASWENKNGVVTGIIDETFDWSDGEKQKRIWKLTKTGENTFEGRADDVIGVAKGEVAGNAFHWTYVLRVPVKDTTYDLDVDDWMYLVTDKVMLNKSVMSKFGFRVGEVTLSFSKP